MKGRNFVLVLLSPMLWTAAILVDKVLTNGKEEDSKPGSLMAICGLFNLMFAAVLFLVIKFTGHSLLDLDHTIPLMLNGILYIAGMWMFLHVLSDEEASRADPWFQTIPVFGAIGAFYMLREMPAWYHIVGIILLVTGGFWLSFHEGKVRFKHIALMLGACICLAVNDNVVATFGRSEEIQSFKDFPSMIPAIFADVSGKALFGLLILSFGKKYREGFALGIKTKFKLQCYSEGFAISADFLFDAAKLIMPIATIQAACCTGPLFTLVGAFFLTKFRPDVMEERVDTKTILHKLGGITLVIIGGVIFAVTT